MAQKAEFLSPVGRMVQGDAFEPQTKDQQGNQLLVKTGPNKGQPTQRFFIAVAFRKDDPAFGAFYQQLASVARSAWPQWFDAAGNCTHPRFSMKVMDGDGVDDNGRPNRDKPGFAGHWIVKFGSSFAPKCFYAGRYAPHEQIQDKKAIPRGYYVRVAGTLESNNNDQKPGIYVNLGMIELVGGEPSMIIQSGPDASAVFGGSAPQLPAGVPAVVMGNVPPAAMPGLPPTPTAPPAQTLPPVAGVSGALPVAPSAMPAPLPVAPLAVAPNPAFLSGPGNAAPPPLPGAAPNAGFPSPLPPAVGLPVPSASVATTSPSNARTMTAAAGGHSYEALIAAGWTDASLRERGMML